MISLVADGYKANFELGDLKVQLAQFSTIVDTDHVSDGWKKFGQKETFLGYSYLKTQKIACKFIRVKFRLTERRENRGVLGKGEVPVLSLSLKSLIFYSFGEFLCFSLFSLLR